MGHKEAWVQPTSVAGRAGRGVRRALVSALCLFLLLAAAASAQPASFSDPTSIPLPPGSGPLSVAVSDFNGDLDPDLAVANGGSNNVSILLGGAGGSFTGPTQFGARASPRSVAVGDFNADSDPDLAVANGGSANVSILLGGAGGSFSAPTTLVVGTEPRSVAVGDFNGDSALDLAVANQLSANVSILLG